LINVHFSKAYNSFISAKLVNSSCKLKIPAKSRNLTIVYEPELPNTSGQTHGNIATAKGKQWRTGKQTFTTIF
jgi:hypothetical protein